MMISREYNNAFPPIEGDAVGGRKASALLPKATTASNRRSCCIATTAYVVEDTRLKVFSVLPFDFCALPVRRSICAGRRHRLQMYNEDNVTVLGWQ